MPSLEQTQRVYEDLAQWYERQGQAKLRDWFLVLAADTALSACQPDEAERLRARLLTLNPHHLLRPFNSFAEAVLSPDVQGYVADLRRTYSPATAEQLLLTQRGTAAESDDWSSPFSSAPALEPVAPSGPQPEPEMKVYRVPGEPEEARPSSALPRLAAPARPPAKPTAATLSRPAPAKAPEVKPPRIPTPAPVKERAPRKAPAPVKEPDYEATVNRWVGLILFGLLLLGGLALGGYVLVRPFLPVG